MSKADNRPHNSRSHHPSALSNNPQFPIATYKPERFAFTDKGHSVRHQGGREIAIEKCGELLMIHGVEYDP
jgi:hypothetical protein